MATVTIKFFARLREQSGVDSMEMELGSLSSLSELVSELQQQHEDWTILKQGNLMTAVNHSMVSGDCGISDGDEIALFPPVTGG